MTALANRLIAVREEKGWKKSDLKRAAGLKSPSTLTDLESGRATQSPQIPQIADALGVNALWLMTGRGEKYARRGLVPDAGLQERYLAHQLAIAETDPVIAALAIIEETSPAKAALFKAQIMAELEEIQNKSGPPTKKEGQSAA